MAKSKRRKQRKGSRSKSRRRMMRLEGLETRTLLAADFVQADVPRDIAGIDPVQPVPIEPPAPGIVIVEGTNEADKIHVKVDEDKLIISVNGDIETHKASEVDIIAVWAKDGNDAVVFDRSVVDQNGVIVAGKGDDYVQGGSDHDWILGGEGNDRLVAGSSRDLLDGGPGDN